MWPLLDVPSVTLTERDVASNGTPASVVQPRALVAPTYVWYVSLNIFDTKATLKFISLLAYNTYGIR